MGLAEAGGTLGPTNTSSMRFADLPADRIASMAGRPERRFADRRLVVFCATCGVTLYAAQVGDKAGHIVSFVGTQCDPVIAGTWLLSSPAPPRARPCRLPGSDAHRPPARAGSPTERAPDRQAWPVAPSFAIPSGIVIRFEACVSVRRFSRGSPVLGCGQEPVDRRYHPLGESSSCWPTPRSRCHPPKNDRPDSSA